MNSIPKSWQKGYTCERTFTPQVEQAATIGVLRSSIWHWWVLPKEDGSLKILDIQEKYLKEMICDWIGAGKAQGFVSSENDKYLETRNWYNKNKSKMQLSTITQYKVEEIIEVEYV